MITKEEYEAIMRQKELQNKKTVNIFGKTTTNNSKTVTSTQKTETHYTQNKQVYSKTQTNTNYVQTNPTSYNQTQRAQPSVNTQTQPSTGHKYLKLVVDEHGRRRYQMVSSDSMPAEQQNQTQYSSERITQTQPNQVPKRFSQRNGQYSNPASQQNVPYTYVKSKPGVQAQYQARGRAQTGTEVKKNVIYQGRQGQSSGQPRPRSRSSNRRKVVVYRDGVKVSEKVYDD